ncbi:N-acetylmuramoyl-L-alanine amidase [Mucilaginibacter sp. BJC16-A38]|uniref:N-acetylmuramoyl-L-alanine amidase family protein n=1 Tax=Mucilaginibacter phenanthrenivorans TaxID=1234842 RepID=UPI002157ACB9|nr:N-acetylmuramoyl-L-alanine amidase [Mucilaginibacter phenanthrenivorans]MCR8559088.1 N-acetylmuramoyl-L-alanine amidase [Mucilaginibacter phenanthrenivorans]
MTTPAKSSKIFAPLTLLLFFILTSFAGGDDGAKSFFKFRTVVIDAGHGGKDPGAHGSYSFEKNVTLAIAKKVERLLKKDMPEINVIMTRSTDRFVQLNKRADIANQNNANLFVSIHCNSSPEGTAKIAHKEKGVMLLVYGYHRKEEQMEALRENASIYIEKDYKKNYDGYNEKDPTSMIVLNTFMQKYRKQSILFGDILEKQFRDNDGRRSRGVKEQGVLVLAHSAMPAVLVETGYINNNSEEKYLNSEDGQNAIAASIVRSIKIYRRETSTPE